MENKELFDKSFNVLLNAYKTDTLVYSTQCACAVGNLVAAANGYEIIKDYSYRWKSSDGMIEPAWGECMDVFGMSSFNKEKYKGQCKFEIESTGYTYEQIIKIENTFCDMLFANPSQSNELKIYSGLDAIVDYLLKIHYATDDEAKQIKNILKQYKPKK